MFQARRFAMRDKTSYVSNSPVTEAGKFFELWNGYQPAFNGAAAVSIQIMRVPSQISA